MNIGESLRFAWRGVNANKVRSALTMLGVLIGVAAVIVLVGVGNGASQSVTQTLSSLGTNTLTVPPGTTTSSGLLGLRRNTTASRSAARHPDQTGDAHRGRRRSAVRAGRSSRRDRGGTVVSPAGVVASYADTSHQLGSLTGSSAGYLGIANDTMSTGRAYTATDVAAHARVVLVGPTAAKALAGGDGSSLLGQEIRLNGVTFTVIGILTEKGAVGARDQDDRMIAPLSSVQDHLAGYGDLTSIAVQAASAETVDAAQAQVEAVLDARHHTGTGTRDFTVTSSASMLSAASSITGTLTVMLGAIAAISLLVGGIGVMNIMLVTVTERTREIGVRKAIGADRTEIVMQFLIEAILLAVFGGLAGVVLGVGLCQIPVAGFRAEVDPASVILAFGFALAVGLFFGIYPATRAASLRPIEALRYE